jgi:formylglycine-generating enzyme required for sulfatase activity
MAIKKNIAGIIILIIIIGLFSIKLFIGKGVIPTTHIINPPNTQEVCPEGFIKVPGNPLYSTSDFCLMKYDAKCTNTNPACVTKEGVYRNDLPGCACQGNFQVVSTPEGAPITYIPEDDGTAESAKAYCKNAGWHLVTNNEWMTVARNVEQVDANWCNRDGTDCGNSPGTPGKILANGHNDSVPNYALPASTDDKPCFGTTSDKSNTCGGKSSQKRTLTLSNGEIVWDMAGNVWQWIDTEITRKDEPQSKIFGHWDYRNEWSEFAPGANPSVIVSDGILSDKDFRPSNPSWNSSQGIGRVYHFTQFGDTDTTLYTTIRAGNWRHGFDSGIFTIHFSPVASKTGIDDVGFRCAVNLK